MTRRTLLLAGLIGLAAGWTSQWSAVATIDGDPVMRGLPRDAIPAIHEPEFVSAAEAAAFMRDEEYVIGVERGAEARAYSVWHLNRHEIVNDTIAGEPIAVTWCPLCYTGIVYSRVIDGRTLSFGVSGMLWRENLVMYDRETDSWWSQATGEAIQGSLAGRRLTHRTGTMVRWRAWRDAHPDTRVLRKTSGRDQLDVYTGYHLSADLGVTGTLRARRRELPEKARIVGFRLNERPFAVDLSKLPSTGLLITTAAEVPIVIVAAPDGSGARIYLAADHSFVVEQRDGERVLVDLRTESVWHPWSGVARSGRLAGTHLDEIPASMSYWFAWQAFFPATTIVR